MVAFKSRLPSQDMSPAGARTGPMSSAHLGSAPDSAQSLIPPILTLQSLAPPSPWLRPVPDSAQSLILPALMRCLQVPKCLDVFSYFAM